MGQDKVETVSFKYLGQRIEVRVLVYPWGDLVQLESLDHRYQSSRSLKFKTVRLPAGSMWRRNRHVALLSNGRTEYQCHKLGAYNLLRSGIHISRQYGIRDASPGTETQELLTDRAKIRYAVVTLMTRGASIADLPAWAQSNYGELVLRYRPKQNIRKVMARQNLERAVQPYDSLGRINRPAMGLAAGSAIGNLDERRKCIRYIDRYMDGKSRSLAGRIREIRDTYRALRVEFEPWMVEIWAAQDSGLQPSELDCRDPGWLELAVESENWPAIKLRLLQHQATFALVHERPFLANATHALEDMREAVSAIDDLDKEALLTSLRRLLQGTRWFFAQEYLYQRIIYPLAFLIEDLRRVARATRRNLKKGDEIKIVRSDHPEAFEDISARFRLFVKKLGRLEEDLIKNQVKPKIWPLARAVFVAMREEEWLKVKRILLTIAALL